MAASERVDLNAWTSWCGKCETNPTVSLIKKSLLSLKLATPSISPKNPIKREKKKLAYSSEREDFIKSGEDQFVRILRVLLNGLLIVFLYNYAVNILCIKTGDGYGFYCLLKQVEIDVQSTSNRKLPNFYEKVTDFLSESYRISK